MAPKQQVQAHGRTWHRASVLGATATTEKARAPMLLVPTVHWGQLCGCRQAWWSQTGWLRICVEGRAPARATTTLRSARRAVPPMGDGLRSHSSPGAVVAAREQTAVRTGRGSRAPTDKSSTFGGRRRVRGEKAVCPASTAGEQVICAEASPTGLTRLTACAAVSSVSLSRGDPSACGRRRALFLTGRRSIGPHGIQSATQGHR